MFLFDYVAQHVSIHSPLRRLVLCYACEGFAIMIASPPVPRSRTAWLPKWPLFPARSTPPTAVREGPSDALILDFRNPAVGAIGSDLLFATVGLYRRAVHRRLRSIREPTAWWAHLHGRKKSGVGKGLGGLATAAAGSSRSELWRGR